MTSAVRLLVSEDGVHSPRQTLIEMALQFLRFDFRQVEASLHWDGGQKEAKAVCLRFESLSRQAAPVTEGKVPAECSGELLEAALSIVQTARRGELSEATGRAFVNRILG